MSSDEDGHGDSDGDEDSIGVDSVPSYNRSSNDDYSSDDESIQSVTEEELEKFCFNIHQRDYAAEIARTRNSGYEDDRAPFNDAPVASGEMKAGALIDLKGQLRNYTRELTSRLSDVEVLGGGQLQDLDLNFGVPQLPMVTHDESLIPYWRELADCIGRFTKEYSMDHFSISGIQLTKETLEILASGLTGEIVKMISLTKNGLCSECVVALSTILEDNQHVEYLTFCENPMDDLYSAMCLSRSLTSMEGLIQLEVRRCNLGINAEVLSALLRSEVKSINFSDNVIDSEGAIKICEYLETNPRIQSLDLNSNIFNDDDAVLFAQALKKNTNLMDINLAGNDFTIVGLKSLLLGMFDYSSLNAISESNHSCSIWIDSCLISEESSRYLSLVNEKFDRMKKILIALHKSESTLHYLADVPVELMPEVIAFIQAETCQIKLTNIMYAAMRWWNMPALYSYHVPPASKLKRKICTIE